MARTKMVNEESLSFDSGRRNKASTKETSKMKTYRFRMETIEALNKLTTEVNKKTNIKISTTNILELLVLNAAKDDVSKIINLIKNR